MKEIDQLVNYLAKLPSLGPRSAKRLVLYLLNNKKNGMLPLIESMSEVFNKIKNCIICGNIDNTDICEICSNKKRNSDTICVVEQISDLWAIERVGIYNGKYHILGGVLSAIDGIGPEKLNINSLTKRIEDSEEISEIILATNSTLEGQTTAYYIVENLKNFNLKISRLAYGIPLGSDLDYLDEGTLDIAFKTRNKF